MNTLKIKAIRQCLINTELDVIVKWQEVKHIEDYSIHNLANYIQQNGDDGIEGIGLTNYLQDAFVKYVDEHTHYQYPNIVRTVTTSIRDFLKEDWDVIFADLFPASDIYDNLVYSVTEEYEGKNTDHTSQTFLFTNYKSAKRFFEREKSEMHDFMKRNCDTYRTDEDDERIFSLENNNYETWCHISIGKKIIFD